MSNSNILEMSKEKYSFWDDYHKALETAEKLTMDRMHEYVGDEDICDYWLNGRQDIMYEIRKKYLRLKRQSVAVKQGETTDRIEDTIIDAINYLAFLYAYIQKEKKEHGQASPPA